MVTICVTLTLLALGTQLCRHTDTPTRRRSPPSVFASEQKQCGITVILTWNSLKTTLATERAYNHFGASTYIILPALKPTSTGVWRWFCNGRLSSICSQLVSKYSCRKGRPLLPYGRVTFMIQYGAVRITESTES